MRVSGSNEFVACISDGFEMAWSYVARNADDGKIQVRLWLLWQEMSVN